MKHKNVIKYLLQLAVILGMYYLADYYDIVNIYIIVLIIIIAGLVLVNSFKVSNKEMYLQITCDTTRYLQKLEQYHKPGKGDQEYHLGMAYAHMYTGDLEAVKMYLQLVDIEQIKNQDRFRPIYIRIHARLAYEEENNVRLTELLNESSEHGYDEAFKGYIKMFLLFLRDQHEDTVDLLTQIIPQQTIRLYIYELEYYLAEAYVALERYEDAKAVLEFIVKKGYSIVHTDLAYERYMEIKDK